MVAYGLNGSVVAKRRYLSVSWLAYQHFITFQHISAFVPSDFLFTWSCRMWYILEMSEQTKTRKANSCRWTHFYCPVVCHRIWSKSKDKHNTPLEHTECFLKRASLSKIPFHLRPWRELGHASEVCLKHLSVSESLHFVLVRVAHKKCNKHREISRNIKKQPSFCQRSRIESSRRRSHDKAGQSNDLSNGFVTFVKGGSIIDLGPKG